MRDVMLSLHFIGIAMGVGTSMAFFFLGKVRAKLPKVEAEQFFLRTLFLGNMAKIGLLLLILSGGYLMTPYWALLTTMPLLIVKLSSVLFLVMFLLIQINLSKVAKRNNGGDALIKIGKLGKISLLFGLFIIVLAVMIFH